LAILLALATSAFAANGFFSVGQDDGRWWFFDPDGERFFSAGVNVVAPGGHYCPALGYSPYHENIIALYGSEAAWADVTEQRLRDWNFNTLGGWSDFGLANETPYTVVLYMSGADWMSGFVPDYWGQDFYDRVADTAAGCAARADDSRLIGWFIDNEMRWGPDWRRVADLFADYIAFLPEAPGKRIMVAWLHQRYGGNLAALNAVYGWNLTNWSDLLQLTEVSPLPKNKTQADDREAWTAFVADHFFQVTAQAIRAADPNHLVMGARFVSWCTPQVVLEAAAQYCDVISVNHYLLWDFYAWLHETLREKVRFVSAEDMLSAYNEISGLPVLISEFSMRGLDAVPPSTYPPNWFFKTADTQTERTAWAMAFVRQCTHSDYVIGYHWFDYMDEPALGRFDGENSNFGLVTEMDKPYAMLVAAFTMANLEAYQWPFE